MTAARSLADSWRRQDVLVRDLPLALLLAAASAVPGLHDRGTQLGDLPARDFDRYTVLVVLLESLPLAARRRWPAVCLALVSVGFVIDQLTGYHTVAGTALPIALLSAGAHLARHRTATVVVASAAYVGLAVTLTLAGGLESLADFIAFYVALAVAWGAGDWLRRSRAAEEERRALVADATRTAERTRIARELHDVVTHHVTAMVVQAEAARYLTAAPERLDASLSAITETGRGAMADLRHLLDVLTPDHDGPGQRALPRDAGLPGLVVGTLHDLVDQARRSGQPVELVEEGAAPTTAGSAGLVVYRVVQEALTNAIKHAHGAPTVVHVQHEQKETRVEIRTAATADSADRPSSATAPPGGGRGLAGLRERVELLGGELSAGHQTAERETAGHQTAGGFVVRARIPVEGIA